MFGGGKVSSAEEHSHPSQSPSEHSMAWAQEAGPPLEEALFQLGGLVGRIEQQGLKLFISQSSNSDKHK